MNFYQYFTIRSGFFFLAFFTLILLSVVVSSSSDPDDNASSHFMMSNPALASGDWDIDNNGQADALNRWFIVFTLCFWANGGCTS